MMHAIILLLTLSSCCFGQEAGIRVHILYGSRPYQAFKSTEKKWFGGKLGGHVGIEYANGEILSFIPRGRFHWFTRDRDRHSMYRYHSVREFYRLFGSNPDSVKRAIITIPVGLRQSILIDSIGRAYISETPYDYAFFGMRCAAATYEILAQLQVLKPYTHRRTYMKIFYPRRLRRILFRHAEKNQWHIESHRGSSTRKWDHD